MASHTQKEYKDMIQRQHPLEHQTKMLDEIASLLTEPRLDLSGPKFGEDGRFGTLLELLANVFSQRHGKTLPNLKTLILSDTSLDKNVMNSLAKAMQNTFTELKVLDLSNSSFDYDSFEDFVMTLWRNKTRHKLETLNLSNTGIGKQRYINMLIVLLSRLPHLTTLDLRNNGFTEDDVQSLSSIAKERQDIVDKYEQEGGMKPMFEGGFTILV